MKHTKLNSLLFLTSVALLLLNDLFLKYEYHNAFTGKLSDFAGLFAFPYFFAVFFPGRAKAIYVATALLFVYWKSELIQPLLNLAHAYGLGFNRVVDYTDLAALAILPLSYLHFKADGKMAVKTGTISKPVIIALCCFAFVATSLPREIGELNMASDYKTKLNVTKQQAVERMGLFGESNPYQCNINVEGRGVNISTLVNITENGNTGVMVELDSILSYDVTPRGGFFSKIKDEDVEYAKQLTKEDIEKLFIEQKIKPLQ